MLRAGVPVIDAGQSDLDLDPAPDDALAGAAVRYRLAVGPLAGQRTMTLRGPTLAESLPLTPGPLTASHEGFPLNAAVFVPSSFPPSLRYARSASPCASTIAGLNCLFAVKVDIKFFA